MSAPNLQGFATIPRAVLHDPNLHSHAKMVYLVLSSHVGGKETVWPSHRAIAEIAGISVAQVKRMLLVLRGVGLIAWKERKPDKKVQLTNEYWLLAGNNPVPEKVVAPPEPRSTRTPFHQNPVPPEPLPAQGELRNESHRTRVKKEPVRLPPNVDAIFDKFWEIYPRREGKGAAKAAFVKVLRRGVTVDMLMHGATRLRDDPNLPDKQFICHPTTWLNQQRWGDDPLPTRTDGRQERRPAPRPAEGLTLQLPINSEAS